MLKKTLTLTFLLFYNYIFSQEQTIKFNDSISQFENLPLNNAISYENKYIYTYTNIKQFLYNEYKSCIISYDDNIYYDVKLKYDVYSNNILYKPKFNIVTEVSLFNEYINYFIIENKKFVKFNINNNYQFYEEIYINGIYTLYIKYKKSKKENYKYDLLRHEFYNDLDIFLYSNNEFILLKNKKEIIKILPKYKQNINEFYNKNKPLQESNIILFYTNLFKNILQNNE